MDLARVQELLTADQYEKDRPQQSEATEACKDEAPGQQSSRVHYGFKCPVDGLGLAAARALRSGADL